MCTPGVHVERVKGLTGCHEQAVALGSTEAEVCAVLRQTDLPDQLAIRCENVHAVVAIATITRSCSEIPIRIATNTVRTAPAHVAEHASVRQPFAIHHVEYPDRVRLPLGLTSVDDVNSLLIW